MQPAREDEITIGDIASAAGVSVRTVSRVINSSPKVNAETRLAVQAVIDRVGFVPSSRARALASRRSFLLGLVHDDPNALSLDHIQRGIVEVCGASGYELVIHPCNLAAGDVAGEIRSFVRRSRVDGVIVIPPVSELEAIPAVLAAMGVQSVAIAAVYVPGHAAMLIPEERRAATEIADHLASLGHRSFGLINGPGRFHSAREREAGFRDGLARRGLSLDEQFVVEGDYGFASGRRCARLLLDRADRPTAIFAANDIMAAAVIKEAAALGLDVPRDVSLVGFDDSEIASMLTPTLTTVRRPLRQMARDLTERLLARLDGYPHATETSRSPVALLLIERGSSGPPRS